MRVLVTGGTGYLGGAIVRALAARGHEPVVFARAATRSELPGQRIDGDVRDVAALVRAAAGCDGLCHSAALVSIWNRHRDLYDAVNVGGLRNALRAASVNDIRRIVYTSSFLAQPPAGVDRPIAANDYQRTKIEAMQVALRAMNEGLPVTCLCPGVLYGPGRRSEANLVGRLVGDHLRRRLVGVVGPEHIWSFAFLEDVAAAHVTALERGTAGATFGVGGENAPVWRVFEIVRDLTGRPLPRRVPYRVAEAVGTIEEARAWLFGGRPAITPGAVEIFRHDWPVDSADASTDLGYRATPLREGLVRLVSSLDPGRSQ